MTEPGKGETGHDLGAARAERYQRLVRMLPRRLDGLRARRCHLTVAHGDAHVWNALYPSAPDATMRIIDWAGWRVGVGALGAPAQRAAARPMLADDAARVSRDRT